MSRAAQVMVAGLGMWTTGSGFVATDTVAADESAEPAKIAENTPERAARTLMAIPVRARVGPSQRRTRAGALLGMLALGAAWSLSPALSAQAWPAPTGTITNLAGNGTTADPHAGAALQSGFDSPSAVAVDDFGDVYVGDCGHTVSKISPSGQLTIVAGNGSAGIAVPGPATRSPLDCPSGIAADAAGNVFFSDSGEHEVFEVSAKGVLSVIAGTGLAGPAVEGPATRSPLDDPTGIAFVNNSLLVADAHGHGRVYGIDSSGQLSFVAGNGTNGSPVPGLAMNSPLGGGDGDAPSAIAAGGDGDFYLADPSNGAVERVDVEGYLSVVAGRGAPYPDPSTAAYPGDPVGLAFDRRGLLYIADAGAGSSAIERVSPSGGDLQIVAGGGAAGAPTFGAAGTASAVDQPAGVAVNGGGAVFVADTGNRTIDRIGVATPSQPNNVRTAADGSSTLLMIDPPFDPGTSPITGYQILWVEGPDDAPNGWHDLPATLGSNSTQATLSGLTYGDQYLLQVRAVNASGPGPESKNVSFIAERGLVLASAPLAVQATVTGASVTVDWQPPVDLGYPTATGYRVIVEDATPGRTQGDSTETFVGQVLTAAVTGLMPGHRYKIYVDARTGAGDGDLSVPVVVTLPPAAPGPPVAPIVPAPPAQPVRPPLPTPPPAVPATQRRTEVAVPRNPLAYHGKLRHTVADGRSRGGTAAFALATLGGYHLHAGQAVSVTDSAIFVGGSPRLSTHGRQLLRAVARDLVGGREVSCESYTDYAVAPAAARALSKSRAAVVCGVVRAVDTRLRAAPVGLGRTLPAVIGGRGPQRGANARTVIDVQR